MYSDYFEEWEVKEEYSKEFISLWEGWLGAENSHKLDEVTEPEWARFNELLIRLAKDFTLELVSFENKSLKRVSNIELLLSNYSDSMNKDSSKFINFVIPELECVVSEEWDFTYIIWHKNNGAVEAIIPAIKAAGLEHFHK